MDANNCFTSNQITLIEPTSLNLSHELSNYNGFNLSCFESNDGFINSSVIGSVPPYSFSWSNGDNTANIDDLPSGNYNLVVTDINNCFIRSNHFLTEPDDFNVNLVFSNDTCDKGVGSAQLTVTPNSNNYSIKWSNNENSNLINNLTIGDYSVEVSDIYDCSKSLSFFIDDVGKPNANFSIVPQKENNFYQNNTQINFEDQSFDNLSTIVSWNWDFGDGNLSDLINTNHLYENAGDYNLVLEIENELGCTDTANTIIRIGKFSSHIPNTFTPTLDTKNEFFSIYGEGILEFELSIYNRWGKRVYNSINQGWSGINQTTNSQCRKGVYVYHFKVLDIFNQTHEFSGDVTLME